MSAAVIHKPGRQDVFFTGGRTRTFRDDVLYGLGRTPKGLDAKYFYDEAGDRLFQKIMSCEEYYLTACETEIFERHASAIVRALDPEGDEFDLVELGAGDATKTVTLLKRFMAADCRFTYRPVDVSLSMLRQLESNLPRIVPGLAVDVLHGEYIGMLRRARELSGRRKAVLFLGANIGNMSPDAALTLCREIRAELAPGDRMLIGFDLKKDPATILAAYNDAAGYTRAFNLNLLHRINRELGGDFDVSRFAHYPTYDPLTGTCKSYLVSRAAQEVRVAGATFRFERGEAIFMEISQKYSLPEIDALAAKSGFKPLAAFTDAQARFVDVVWRCA